MTNYDQPLGGIDRQTRRHLNLTKAHPHRQFRCDSCGIEYQSDTLYSLAHHEIEVPNYRAYCEKCLKAIPAGQKRYRLEKKKNIKKFMPKIEKKKNLLPVVKTTKKKKTKKTKTLAKPRSARSKENTLAYYDCIKDQVAANDNVKITAMSHECKYNKGKVAWTKREEKQQLVKEVAKSYLEFGKSLGTLLHADITNCSCKK